MSDRRARTARRLASLLAASVLGMSAPGVTRAAPAPYRIDVAQSELVVRVFKGGAAAALAHDHVVRATAWQGTIDIAREPVALAAEIVVDARALEVDDPAVRVRYGFTSEVSASDRSKTREAMLGADQLDVARYPEIRFRTAEIDRDGAAFRVAGELTVHGSTRRISLPIGITEDDGRFTARGTVRLRQTDFGITPYSAFLGAVRTQDEVELVVTIVAAPENVPEHR